MMWKVVVVLPLLAALFAIGSSSMPGGTQDANTNDPDFINALNFALSQYNRESDDPFYRKLIRVVRALEQVVEGINYYITAILSRTKCSKFEYGQNCPSQRPPQVFQCEFVVWSRPWLDDMQLTNSQCQELY